MEPNRQPVGGESPARPLWPLDEQRTLREGFLEPELVELTRLADAVEVGVSHGEARQCVALDEREGRARHLDRRARERVDQAAGELGLAGAELALEADQIARAKQRGEPGGERAGRGAVGEVDDETAPRLNSGNAPACTGPRSARRCRRPAWA